MPPRRRNPSIDMDVDDETSDPFAFAASAASAAADSLSSSAAAAGKANQAKTDAKKNNKFPTTSSTKPSSASASAKKATPTPSATKAASSSSSSAAAKSSTKSKSPPSDDDNDDDDNDTPMSFSTPRPRGRPKGTFRKLNLSADQAAAAAAAMRETALRIQEMQKAHAQVREKSRQQQMSTLEREEASSPPRKRGRPFGSTVPTSQASLKRAREAAEAAGGEHTDAGAEAFRQALKPLKPRILLANSMASPMKKAAPFASSTMSPFSKAGTSSNRALSTIGGEQIVKRGRGRPPKYPRPLGATSSSSSSVPSKPRATILDLEAAPPLSQKDDVCCICHDGGILFVCESCVHAYHEVCLERFHVDNFDTMKSLADDQPLYCSDVHLECTTRKVPKQEANLKREREEGEEEGGEEDANDSKKFKWIGKKSHMANGRRYYNSFSLRGNIYTIGSFITLKNNSNDPRMMVPTKKSNAASPRRCLDYVGQIDEMYEDNHTGYKYIVHRWLYLPEETRSGRLPHHLYNEIFMTAHMDHNEVEAIERSVEVVDFEEWQRRQEEEAVAKKKNSDAAAASASASADDKGKQKTSEEKKKEEEDDDDNSPDAYDLFVVRQTYDDDRGEFRPYLAPKSRVVRSTKNNIAHGELFSPPNIKTGKGNATPGPGGKSQSIYSQACAQLQLSAAPPRLPCRDKERDFISRFIERGIQTGQSDGGLYIAGVPGTGKTATVVRVISELAAREDMPNFEYVEINGMKLPDPHQLYTALWKALTGKHSSPMKAVQMLDQRFKTTHLRRPVCVLLVDELDYIMTRQQNVIYNLFDWPARRAARLIVIGISNTIDLPDLLLPRVNSRLGLTKLHFEPYNTHQILEIIQDRLRELPAFAEDAIELCARKIASVSGDIRRALQICRRAAEICEEDQLKINTTGQDNSQRSKKNLPPPPAKAGIIGEHHILRAISDLQNSNFIHYLQHSASVYDKLLLSGMLSSIKYSASPSGASNAALHSDTNPPIPLLTLIDHTERNADVRGVRRLIASKVGVPIEDFPQKTSVAEWFLLVQQWAQLKIAQLNYPRGERWPTVQLNILTDDLEHAFKDEELWEKLRSQ